MSNFAPSEIDIGVDIDARHAHDNDDDDPRPGVSMRSTLVDQIPDELMLANEDEDFEFMQSENNHTNSANVVPPEAGSSGPPH